MERKGEVTFFGNPLTLLGPVLNVGDDAPNVELLDNEFKPVSLSSYKGKAVLLSVVPSLDTSVCDIQARTFNEKAAGLGDDVLVVTVSVDLPPAQARWCGAAGADRIITLSDHRDTAFGLAYGVLIKELRLLARSIFVVDKEGTLRYKQIVPEVTDSVDFDAALAALNEVS